MNARERLIYDFEEDIVRRHATLEGASPRLIAKTVEVGTNIKALRGEDIWAGAKFEVARLSELKQRCAQRAPNFGLRSPTPLTLLPWQA